MSTWIKCNTPGIRYRIHATRKHGVGFDKYFTIRYKVAGKEKSEGLGWASEGWSEKKAAAILSELKANATVGTGPRTLNEKRELQMRADSEKAEREREEEVRQELEHRTKLRAVYSQYCCIHSDKKSLKNESSLYEKWIEPVIGEKRLNEIILLDLERIRKRMEKAGKAPRTIQYVKSIVRQVYTFATAHSLYSGDIPTRLFLKNKKFDNARKRYLTPDEARLLLNELQKHSQTLYRMSLLSLNTAMRFGEIASLRWQHINLNNREILVVDPKNSETRSVFMTEEVEKLFRFMEKGTPNDIVFPTRHSRKSDGETSPEIQGSVSNVFDRVVRALGLNEGITDRRMRVVFHSLRHTAASWLVNSGVGLPVIGKVLGHKSLKMTERYSHVSDDSVRSAMDLLDQKQNGQDILRIQNG
ncbi:MAG: site-specific integrase [Desulfocapsaceae bacterium]|nr:site-specific integrase [Desulfocapsaceae bacterium]